MCCLKVKSFNLFAIFCSGVVQLCFWVRSRNFSVESVKIEAWEDLGVVLVRFCLIKSTFNRECYFRSAVFCFGAVYVYVMYMILVCSNFWRAMSLIWAALRYFWSPCVVETLDLFRLVCVVSDLLWALTLSIWCFFVHFIVRWGYFCKDDVIEIHIDSCCSHLRGQIF